jgi:hypothetical protein
MHVMLIGTHTKQIGNCLHNLVINKNSFLKCIKTLSKRNNEIRRHKYAKKSVSDESQNSQRKPRRPANILQLHINKTMTIVPTLKSQRDQKYGEKLKLTKNTANVYSNVTRLPSRG